MEILSAVVDKPAVLDKPAERPCQSNPTDPHAQGAKQNKLRISFFCYGFQKGIYAPVARFAPTLTFTTSALLPFPRAKPINLVVLARFKLYTSIYFGVQTASARLPVLTIVFHRWPSPGLIHCPPPIAIRFGQPVATLPKPFMRLSHVGSLSRLHWPRPT